MIGIRDYWIVTGFGFIICFTGIVHGTLVCTATIANKYGAVAVALTFGMLFLSRGTAFKLLDTPVIFTPTSVPTAERLQKAIANLSSKKFTEATAVRDLVDCLVDIDIKMEIALINGKREEADKLDMMVQAAIEELRGPKRTAVEANFLAKKALHSAQRTREALAALLDSNRKESVPIAILSIVATLCAGLGDAIVNALG